MELQLGDLTQLSWGPSLSNCIQGWAPYVRGIEKQSSLLQELLVVNKFRLPV